MPDDPQAHDPEERHRTDLPGRGTGGARGTVRVGVLLLAMVAGSAAAEDRHAGYYYPPPSVESYPARADTLPDSDRGRRIGFVVQLTKQMLERPYPPRFAFLVKGEEAEKLMIVALQDDVIDTLYRARALLAMLTSIARATPLFQEFGVAELYTFLDLLELLGFEQVTVSDGDAFAHQVRIE